MERTVDQRIEALKRAQEMVREAKKEEYYDLERLLNQLIYAMERVSALGYRIKRSLEKVEWDGPSSWNSLGELRSVATEFDVAVGQASILADLLASRITDKVPSNIVQTICQEL